MRMPGSSGGWPRSPHDDEPPKRPLPQSCHGESNRSAGNGRTVLVVDDDADVRETVCRMVRSFGYEVLSANGPEDAHAVAHSETTIDVLLSDVMMPNQNGFELAEELTAVRPGIRVLLMTGCASAALACAGQDGAGPFGAGPFSAARGATPLLLKPFSPTELEYALEHVLAIDSA